MRVTGDYYLGRLLRMCAERIAKKKKKKKGGIKYPSVPLSIRMDVMYVFPRAKAIYLPTSTPYVCIDILRVRLKLF